MPTSSLYKRLVFVGILVILLIVLHWANALSKIETWFIAKTDSLLTRNTSMSIAVGNQYQFFKNKSDFINAASACLDFQASSTLNQIELQKLQRENDELRQMIAFAKTQTIAPVMANVISKDVASSDQIIIIDKGSDDGFSVGMPVVAHGSVYVGSIIKVLPKTSAVKLLNDNTSKVAVTVQNNERSIGVLEGGFGISLKIRFIPRNENIHAGDKVITSGLEEKIPRGLAIGQVSIVENEAYQPFQEAVVSPILNYEKLSLVGVLTHSN